MNKTDEKIISIWAKHLANGSSEKDSEITTSDELNIEFTKYNKTWKLLEEMQEIEKFDTDKAWNKVFSKIEDDGEMKIQDKKNNFGIKQIFAVAASIIILLGIGGFLLKNQFGTVTHFNENKLAQLIVLPDGSEVHLNTLSEIRYRKNYGAKVREVTLKGEAFFSVEKNADKPFIVQSAETFVKVLGTSFNIDAKTESIKVTVKTGRVEVYNNKLNSEHVMLLAGDKAYVTEDNKINKLKNTDNNYLSWLDKKLIFKALPLSQVIYDIMNTYHCDIEFSDTSMASLKLTTTFDNDSIDDVLKSISIALNFHIEKEGKKYILVSN